MPALKIRIYIVTYKRNEVLNENLASLWASILPQQIERVTVLSNHPGIEIKKENLRDNLSIIINTARMPNAWGNLARDWNFGILEGFKTWQNPEAVDWVVLAQNDVVWKSGWVDGLRERGKFQLITQPRGDQVVALQSAAVNTLGFFDERFSVIQFQEYDYFVRAMLILGERASITDDHRGTKSCWNPSGAFMIHPTHCGDQEVDNLHTGKFYQPLMSIAMQKWRLLGVQELFDLDLISKRRNYLLKNFPEEINWYPFFWDGCPSIPKTLRNASSLVDAGQVRPETFGHRVLHRLRRIQLQWSIRISEWLQRQV